MFRTMYDYGKESISRNRYLLDVRSCSAAL